MLMKLPLVLLVLLAPFAHAVTCTDYTAPPGADIEIRRAGSEVHFKLPMAIESYQLKYVVLWGYREKSPDILMSVPLAYAINGEVAEGMFILALGLFEAEISASYSDDVCGPRLRVSI